MSDTTSTNNIPNRGKRRSKFYEAALSEVERLLLSEARELEGLDEEIALLRVKLLTALREEPQNHDLHLKQAAMLVRAVATRYRLGNKAQKDLYQSVDEVIKTLGASLLNK